MFRKTETPESLEQQANQLQCQSEVYQNKATLLMKASKRMEREAEVLRAKAKELRDAQKASGKKPEEKKNIGLTERSGRSSPSL